MKYRKKPVVIEAVQWQPPDHEGSVTLAHGGTVEYRHPLGWVIDTLEGPHLVSPGDWIIKGVKGEFYPCKPDIFAATHEPAEPAVPQPLPPAPAADVEELLDVVHEAFDRSPYETDNREDVEGVIRGYFACLARQQR